MEAIQDELQDEFGEDIITAIVNSGFEHITESDFYFIKTNRSYRFDNIINAIKLYLVDNNSYVLAEFIPMVDGADKPGIPMLIFKVSTSLFIKYYDLFLKEL